MTIYVLQSGKRGPVKIGWANGDGRKRLSELQVAHHTQLVCRGIMIGGLITERKLHAKFIEDHIRGEWFRPSAAIRDFIRTLDPPPIKPPRKGNPGKVLSKAEAKEIGSKGGHGKGVAMQKLRDGIAAEWLLRNIARNEILTWAQKLELLESKISEATLRRLYL